jgi:hypothetical protein
MKKFSTAARFLILASIFTPFFAFAQSTPANSPRCEFLPNAPDQHKVVRGDTLWDISGKFLQHPWCWPQVWGLNREQIHNPHWIYPGQIVYFDRAAGRLRLGSPVADNAMGDVRLSPQVRIEGIGRDAIPAIPPNAIEPFLTQPLVIEDEEGLKDTPYIVATQEGRLRLGKGDKAYVRGNLNGATSFQAFHPGKALIDPVTNKILGYEAVYLGTLKLDRAARTDDEAHSFTVVSAKEEMNVGDRLLPVPPTPILNYVPHAPEQAVKGAIVSIYDGVAEAGQNQIVTINLGKDDGMDLGTVLQLYRLGEIVPDEMDDKKPVKLPDEQYGSLFIFRVFNHLSYGLVMQVSDTVKIGDIVQTPE